VTGTTQGPSRAPGHRTITGFLVWWLLVTAGITQSAQRDTRAAVTNWVAANQRAIVAELLDLLAIPNVAADVANIRRNAEHLRGMLQRRGFAAELPDPAR
jgi:hypothetical protein